MRHLTTCGTCGGTAAWSPTGYRHVADRTSHPHPVSPDDGAVSGPDRDDLPPCTGCGHPEHDDDDSTDGLCEERVGTGQYGSDGIEVTRWCACPGPAPVRLAAVSPDPWLDPDAAAAASPPPF